MWHNCNLIFFHASIYIFSTKYSFGKQKRHIKAVTILEMERWKVWIGAEPVAWRTGKLNGERRMGKHLEVEWEFGCVGWGSWRGGSTELPGDAVDISSCPGS